MTPRSPAPEDEQMTPPTLRMTKEEIDNVRKLRREDRATIARATSQTIEAAPQKEK